MPFGYQQKSGTIALVTGFDHVDVIETGLPEQGDNVVLSEPLGVVVHSGEWICQPLLRILPVSVGPVFNFVHLISLLIPTIVRVQHQSQPDILADPEQVSYGILQVVMDPNVM